MPVAQKAYALLARRGISSLNADKLAIQMVYQKHSIRRNVGPANISDIAEIDGGGIGNLQLF